MSFGRRLHNKLLKERFFDFDKDTSIDIYSTTNRLLFKYSSSGKVQTWSLAKSISNIVGYKKHLPSKKKSTKNSKYNDVVNPSQIETLAFLNCYGYLQNEVRIFFFAKFSKNIGYEVTSKKGTCANTTYLKVQVDKSGRSLVHGRKNGYKFEMHGYPISFAELESDFSCAWQDIDNTVIDI